MSGVELPGRLHGVGQRIEQWHVGQGTVAGLVAFPLGYLLTAVVVAVGGTVDTSKPLEVARVVGYVFYNGHNVPLHQYGRRAVTTEGTTQLTPYSETTNLLKAASTSVPAVVYYLVPVAVLLVVAGLLTVRYADADRPGAVHAGLVGGLALGYLLATMAGSYVIAEANASGEAWVVANPHRVTALAAGLGYPLVLGIVGTAAVFAWRRVAGS